MEPFARQIAVPRLEENRLPGFNRIAVQFRHGHGCLRFNFDHVRIEEESLNRHLIKRFARLKKVERRVDMCSGVAAHHQSGESVSGGARMRRREIHIIRKTDCVQPKCPGDVDYHFSVEFFHDWLCDRMDIMAVYGY